MAGKVLASYEIEAECISEQFAINAEIVAGSKPDEVSYDDSRWSVTHIPTGYAVVTGLPRKGIATAAARRMDELGFRSESEDPRVATQELSTQGLTDFKAWLLTELGPGKRAPAKQLEAAIARWPDVRGPKPRGAPKRPSKPSRKTKPKPKPKKEAAKPKKKRPKKEKKAPEEPLDLLAMARKIRGENPADLTQQQARIKDECLW